jgi:hypothetical protein
MYKTDEITGEKYVDITLPEELLESAIIRAAIADESATEYDNLALKAVFLVDMMMLHGSCRTIVFLSSQKQCDEFVEIFNEIVE